MTTLHSVHALATSITALAADPHSSSSPFHATKEQIVTDCLSNEIQAAAKVRELLADDPTMDVVVEEVLAICPPLEPSPKDGRQVTTDIIVKAGPRIWLFSADGHIVADDEKSFPNAELRKRKPLNTYKQASMYLRRVEELTAKHGVADEVDGQTRRPG